LSVISLPGEVYAHDTAGNIYSTPTGSSRYAYS
jgi:hypothetical protein